MTLILEILCKQIKSTINKNANKYKIWLVCTGTDGLNNIDINTTFEKDTTK